MTKQERMDRIMKRMDDANLHQKMNALFRKHLMVKQDFYVLKKRDEKDYEKLMQYIHHANRLGAILTHEMQTK